MLQDVSSTVCQSILGSSDVLIRAGLRHVRSCGIPINQICGLLHCFSLINCNYPQLSPLIGFSLTRSAHDKHLQADALRVNRKGDDVFALGDGRGMTYDMTSLAAGRWFGGFTSHVLAKASCSKFHFDYL